MIEKAQGLIFDLDGTIIDSSWVWDMVDIKFLGDRGFQVPEDYVEAISPMKMQQFIQLKDLDFIRKDRKI